MTGVFPKTFESYVTFNIIMQFRGIENAMVFYIRENPHLNPSLNKITAGTICKTLKTRK